MDRQDWLNSGKGREEDGEGEKEGREKRSDWVKQFIVQSREDYL